MRAGWQRGSKVAGLVAVAGLVGMAPLPAPSQMTTAPAAYAGVDAAGHATTVEAALRGMTAQAAVMFVGTVTGVTRVGGDGFAAAAGVVEITFAVERGIRGVSDGQSYTVREWGGLWTASEQRYRVGSRLLMLLHAPGPTGLSSPVDGMDGAIPVKGSSPLVAAENGTTATDAPVADLRWLAAKLARTVVYGNRTTGQVMPQTHAVRTVVAAASAKPAAAQSMAVAAETAGVETARLQDASVPVAQASVATVLQMMAGWQKETVDAR